MYILPDIARVIISDQLSKQGSVADPVQNCKKHRLSSCEEWTQEKVK